MMIGFMTAAMLTISNISGSVSPLETNLPAHDEYLLGLGKNLPIAQPEHRQLTQKIIIEPLTPEEFQELHEEHFHFGLDTEPTIY